MNNVQGDQEVRVNGNEIETKIQQILQDNISSLVLEKGSK